MKKLLSIVLIMALVASFAFAAGTKEDAAATSGKKYSGKVMIYS